MQFQIPQFIDTENKVVGPLTLKQFFYIAAAVIISFLLFFVIQLWLWIMIAAFLGGVAVSLAFIKINGQPLPKVVIRGFFFYWHPKLYLWQREVEQKTLSLPSGEGVDARERLRKLLPEAPNVKKLWQNLLTTKMPIPKREKSLKPPGVGRRSKEKFQVLRKLTREKEIARRVDYR